jgi:membrane protein implicated in regulation of membrane protease activity
MTQCISYISLSLFLFLPFSLLLFIFFREGRKKKNDNRRKNTQFTETLFNLRGKTRKMMDNLNS